VNSLIKEFHIMEHRQRIKLSRRKIKEIVYELTKSFLALLKRRGDELAMSAAEQARLIAEANSKMAVRDDEAKELAKELEHDQVIAATDREDVL
jgi:cell division protein FtsB